MSTLYHFHLDVRGVLKNMGDCDLGAMFKRADGHCLAASEAKVILLDHLAAGHEVIPIGPPCEGFDYSGGACPGHPEKPSLELVHSRQLLNGGW